MRYNIDIMRLLHSIPLTFAVTVGFTAPVVSAFAQEAEQQPPEIPAAEQAAMDEEVRFIGALVEANMPDIAADVIASAKKKWSQIGPRLEVLEQQGELRLGHFDKVKEIIAQKKKGSPEYWALNLALADAYYARGNNAERDKIYDAFFKAVPKPTPELRTFWLESSYKWAQMLIQQKRFDEATRIFDTMLGQNLDEDIWCMVSAENAELLLRLASEIPNDPKNPNIAKRDDYLKRAEKVIDKLLWKRELIIWFGRAVAMKAHVSVLRGQLDKAQDLVNDYMGDLSEIHNQLVEQDPDGTKGYVRLSPMPQCRYLLADILFSEAEKMEKSGARDAKDKIADAILGAKKGAKRNGNGAYNHAINVYIKYPESPWAAQAGELVEKICDMIMRTHGKDLRAATKIPPGQMKKVVEMQFKNAIGAFQAKDYAAAETQLIDALRQYPEIEESVGAVTTLAETYSALGAATQDQAEKEYYRMMEAAVAGYLAERFAGNRNPDVVKAAGEQSVRLADTARSLGKGDVADGIYDAFFANYPTHYLAAQTAWQLANGAWAKNDWAKAAHYYEAIVENFPQSPNRQQSLKLVPVCYQKAGDIDNQVKALKRLAKEAAKPMDRITTQLQLANLQQKEGFAAFKKADDGEGGNEVKNDAVKKVWGAITAFGEVAKQAEAMLADPSLSEKDRTKVNGYREIALYLVGDCWQRLNFPIKTAKGEMTVESFRDKALAAFEAYLAAFPKGKFGATALTKIGTIYTARQQMDKAQEALARLQRDFPDSSEAKNSVPRLAKNLMEMGLRKEGTDQYRLMLSAGGKYVASQYLEAGDALLEARSWDVAQQAYLKTIELAEKGTNEATKVYYLSRSRFGIAKANFGARRISEAHEGLTAFLDNDRFAKSSLVSEVYELLLAVASEEGRTEKDDERRQKFFNEAIGAIKKLRGYNTARLNALKGKEELTQQDQALKLEVQLRDAEFDLMVSDIRLNQVAAEEAMGLKPQADVTRRKAVAGYQAFLMAHEPNEQHPLKDMPQKELELLEKCYGRMLPEMARLGKEFAQEVVTNGEKYLEYFPNGPHKADVQNAIASAKADL